jgi:hypothetical protein
MAVVESLVSGLLPAHLLHCSAFIAIHPKQPTGVPQFMFSPMGCILMSLFSFWWRPTPPQYPAHTPVKEPTTHFLISSSTDLKILPDVPTFLRCSYSLKSGSLIPHLHSGTFCHLFSTSLLYGCSPYTEQEQHGL